MFARPIKFDRASVRARIAQTLGISALGAGKLLEEAEQNLTWGADLNFANDKRATDTQVLPPGFGAGPGGSSSN
ncbi:MAG: hypothetical protein WCT41_02025 [Candidatus Paceibacterota bacterium]|jgi:hypothetical protein